jgi:hypothetical protein
MAVDMCQFDKLKNMGGFCFKLEILYFKSEIIITLKKLSIDAKIHTLTEIELLNGKKIELKIAGN